MYLGVVGTGTDLRGVTSVYTRFVPQLCETSCKPGGKPSDCCPLQCNASVAKCSRLCGLAPGDHKLVGCNDEKFWHRYTEVNKGRYFQRGDGLALQAEVFKVSVACRALVIHDD